MNPLSEIKNQVASVTKDIQRSMPSVGGPRIALDSQRIRSIIDSARSLSDPHNDLYRTLTKGVETVARQLPEAPAIVRTTVKIGNEVATDIAEKTPVSRAPLKQLAGNFTVLLELLKGKSEAKGLILDLNQPQPQSLASEGLALV
ncbi:MAG: hypothetical protein ABIH50_06990 [bacterium]